MANELSHVSVGTELTQAEYEGITAHQFNAQAIGDILYASTTTQLRRLAIGSTNQLLIVSGGIPAWANPTTLALGASASITTTTGDLTLSPAGNISIGANKLTTTNLLLKQESSGTWCLRNLADNGYTNLRAQYLLATESLEFETDGKGIRFKDADNGYGVLLGRDNGVGLVEVARVLGAADPEFQLGLNGNALRSSYAGYLGFFATAPQAKPIGVAVTAAGIHAALVTLGLIAA